MLRHRKTLAVLLDAPFMCRCQLLHVEEEVEISLKFTFNLGRDSLCSVTADTDEIGNFMNRALDEGLVAVDKRSKQSFPVVLEGLVAPKTGGDFWLQNIIFKGYALVTRSSNCVFNFNG